MARTREKGRYGLTNRPALWVAAALALGITAADLLRPHPLLVLAALVALLIWAGLARRRAVALLLLVVGTFGALRYAYVQTVGRGDLGAWEGETVELTGTVSGEPELRGPQNIGYVLAVEHVGSSPAAGKVYVTQFGGTTPGYGERVQLKGRLKQPTGPRVPGGFDQAAYLARQSIYYTVDTGEARSLGPGSLNWLRRAAVAARVRLENVLKATLPPRDAALAAGLLFGTRSDIPDDVKNAFQASGVLHLLAVSGGNVAMILLVPRWLLLRAGVRKRIAAALLIPLVVFFVFLTGAGPSVLRAGLMALLVLLGEVLRREKDAVNTLGAAAAMLLLWSPGLLFDVGFQLSAGATLGILLLARRIEGWLSPRLRKLLGVWLGPKVAEGLSVTLAAQALVEPISLHTFGTFSTVAPLANLLVLSLVELIVPVGSLASLLGLVSLPLARAISWFVHMGLGALVWMVKAVAAIPGAYLAVGQLPAAGVLAWYAALLVLAYVPARQAAAGLIRRLRPGGQALTVAACVALVAVTGFTWSLALADPPDTLRVTFLDIGQGDAIVVEAPGGRSMVIDTGNATPSDPKTGRPGFDAGAEVVLPFLKREGIHRLDYLVLTHPDQDHAGGGAAVLEGIPVGTVLKSDGGSPTESRYVAALTDARRQGVAIRQPVAGDRIDLGGGVILDVLNPPAKRFSGTRSDDNANCIAMRLRYRKIAMLFTCDLEAEAEDQLVASSVPLQADLLKVAHHGSGYSSTLPFLKAVRPQYAVISVGNGNPFHHPAAGALDRLSQVGAEVFRTDRHGTVTARTDGFTLSVRGEKGGPQAEKYHPLGLLGRRWWFSW